VTVSWPIRAQDDLPALQIRDIWRIGQVQQSEEVDSGRGSLHDEAGVAVVVGRGRVVEENDLLVDVEVSACL